VLALACLFVHEDVKKRSREVGGREWRCDAQPSRRTGDGGPWASILISSSQPCNKGLSHNKDLDLWNSKLLSRPKRSISRVWTRALHACFRDAAEMVFSTGQASSRRPTSPWGLGPSLADHQNLTKVLMHLEFESVTFKWTRDARATSLAATRSLYVLPVEQSDGGTSERMDLFWAEGVYGR
jgi:hypothetical protein